MAGSTTKNQPGRFFSGVRNPGSRREFAMTASHDSGMVFVFGGLGGDVSGTLGMLMRFCAVENTRM